MEPQLFFMNRFSVFFHTGAIIIGKLGISEDVIDEERPNEWARPLASAAVMHRDVTTPTVKCPVNYMLSQKLNQLRVRFTSTIVCHGYIELPPPDYVCANGSLLGIYPSLEAPKDATDVIPSLRLR